MGNNRAMAAAAWHFGFHQTPLAVSSGQPAFDYQKFRAGCRSQLTARNS